MFANYKSILKLESVVLKIKWLHRLRRNDNINGNKTSSFSFCKPLSFEKIHFCRKQYQFWMFVLDYSSTLCTWIKKGNRWDAVFVEFFHTSGPSLDCSLMSISTLPSSGSYNLDVFACEKRSSVILRPTDCDLSRNVRRSQMSVPWKIAPSRKPCVFK